MPVNRTAKPLPTTFIPRQEVNARIKKFMQTKHPALSAAIGKPESSSGWYSLSEMEQIMRELYYLNADGLRFYFSAYDETHPTCANQLTISLVPTFYNETEDKHEDIVLEEEPGFTTRSGSENAASETGEYYKNMDYLSMCQPYCSKHKMAYPFE